MQPEVIPEELPTRTDLLGLVRGYKSPIGGGCIIEKYQYQTNKSGKTRRYGPYLWHVTKHKGVQDWKYLGKKGSARADAALRRLGVLD
ncbi:MAG: hypothetical protein ACW968_07575 [Candidatus Thorarchaeota archaeon]|jgi:hypothetical protein